MGAGRPERGLADRRGRGRKDAQWPGRAPVSSALVRRTGPILIAVIGLLALVIDFWPNLYLPALTGTEGPRKIETKLGLDLQGGLKVEYRVDPNGDRIPTLADVEVVKEIIARRVNATGVSEPVVVTSGTDRIVVEVPGISDTAAIRKLVGQTGQLQFVPIPTSHDSTGPGLATHRRHRDCLSHERKSNGAVCALRRRGAREREQRY